MLFNSVHVRFDKPALLLFASSFLVHVFISKQKDADKGKVKAIKCLFTGVKSPENN